MELTEEIDYGKNKKWLDVIREPLQYSISEKENAYIYVRRNFMTIIQTNDIFELCLDSFVELLRSDDLNVDNEIKVFECIKQWVSYTNSNPVDVMGKLIQTIRLSLLPTEFLIDNILPYIWNIDSCLPYFSEALHWKFSTDRKLNTERTRTRKIFMPDSNSSKYIMAFANNVARLYDIKENKWQRLKNPTLTKNGVGAYTLMNDRLIFTGGNIGNTTLNQVDEMNLSTRIVKSLAHMNEPRSNHQLVTHGKGKSATIFALGGALRGNTNGIETVERYDPISDKWTYVSPMISKRYGFGAAVHGDEIYVIGGYGAGKYPKNIEVYHINENRWEMKSAMNQQRLYGYAVIAGDFLYVMGGSSYSYSSGHLSTVERYDILNDTWTTIADISTIGWVGVSVIGNSPVAIGGYNSDVVEFYDSQKNVWKKMASLDQKIYVEYAFQVPLEVNNILDVWL